MSAPINEARIRFFLKTTKSKHVKDMMEKGEFCFVHPTVFSKWETKDSAQYDKWEAYSAYEATHMVYAPIIGEKDGKPIYGPVKQFADRGIIREQSEEATHTPICCFRMVEDNEVTIHKMQVVYSLGKTADRIQNEFGHDAYIMIQATPFLERLQAKYWCISGNVVYKNTLNDYEFQVPERYKDIVEQLFRKDEAFAWQKEYRIILSPSNESPVFVELGSIKDIAICGSISDLRG